jgi:transposase
LDRKPSQESVASHGLQEGEIGIGSAGASYQDADRAVGRHSGAAVSRLVARFNREGLAALEPRHGGGRATAYGAAARNRILREVARTPTPERDGTATWSLSTLRRVPRSAPDGLPRVSTFTLWRVLREADYTQQRTRTWCLTGAALRRREAGTVTVTDPDAESKKNGSRTPAGWASRWGWRSGAAMRRGRSRPCPSRARAGGRRQTRPGSRMSRSVRARPRC